MVDLMLDLNGDLRDLFQRFYSLTQLKMHNKVTKRIHLKFYLMVRLSMNMSLQLRVLLIIHLKAHLHLMLKLRVVMSCT